MKVRAAGVKAPPVTNTIRLATAGADADRSACSSMPVRSGIIKSQRTTSTSVPLGPLSSSSA